MPKLFKGSFEERQRFMEALGRMLNAEVPTLLIEVVVQAMQPSADERATSNP